ncbi:MAG: alpha-L-fucosidase [Candidatus Hydrogenedentes bacterium]|nr:alpha-L-fucosidase [Candidatus Hydrogenedentota bacterium]
MLGAVVTALLSGAEADLRQPAPHKTDWFKDAGWGVFTHYLSDIALRGQEPSVEAWNRVVDAFDVEGLAKQLASVGTKYYFVTLGQNSGYYCSANATYDRLVGNDPGKCSKRDLIADLYQALEPRGIKLMVYLPAGAPDRDPKAMEALGWKPGKYPIWSHPKGGPDGGDPRLEDFQRKWEAVIREWSERWGNKVCGWWFDGCYYPVAMYQHPEPPNFKSFAEAARAGNPASLVAFNPGVFDPIFSLTEHEDYTAGEINEADKVQCPGRWVKTAQFHMLSFLGPNWAQRPPRYSDAQVIEITQRIIEEGGVATWDVPIEPSGLIPDAFVTQLQALHTGIQSWRANQ